MRAAMKIFTGYDAREAIGWHVFASSLIRTSKKYQLMPPVYGEQLDGSNAFTYARFSVPERCGWSGWALYVDGSDMILRADIAELEELQDDKFAVLVAKHDYKTSHPRKYVGTEMEADNRDYPRKNWSSVILWNCGHAAHFMARDHLRGSDGPLLHRFGWLPDRLIGDLPLTWNWLDEYGENPEAKLIHYTTGIPGFAHYAQAPHAREWKDEARAVNRGLL